MTYGELLASLARLSIRTDLTDVWPDFVRRAHDRIVDEVVLSAPLAVANREATLPTDLSEVVAVWVDGSPREWVVDGPSITVCLPEEGDYAGSILYRIGKPFFADDAATNDVLTAYPWVYRYGALAEAYRFTRDTEGAAQEEAAFMGEMARINRAATNTAAGRIVPR